MPRERVVTNFRVASEAGLGNEPGPVALLTRNSAANDAHSASPPDPPPTPENGRTVLEPGALHRLIETLGDAAGDLLPELVSDCIADSERRLHALRHGIDTGAPQEVGRAAHSLKSHGLTFGAPRFAELCRRLEAVANTGDLADAGPLANQIGEEYQNLRLALEALSEGSMELPPP